MSVPHFQTQTPLARAKATRAHAKARFLGGEFADWPAERDYAASFIGSVESSQTASTYASALISWFRWCRERGMRPFDATRRIAKEYLVDLAHLAPMTRSNRCVAARSFYDYVLDDEPAPIESNPFARVKPKNAKPRRTTPALEQGAFEDLLGFLEARIERDPKLLLHKRDFTLIYLMGRLGPRAITTSHLAWGSLHPDGGRILLNLHLKSDRYEDVAVPEDVLRVLAHWHRVMAQALGRAPTSEDALFPPLGRHARRLDGTRTVLPMSQDGIGYVVKQRLRGAGVVGPRWAAHAMRATAATIAYEHGASVEECQAMLCHLNRSQTEAYIKRRATRSAASHWQPSRPAGGRDAPAVSPPALPLVASRAA